MAKRTVKQEDREQAISQIAFWMGASELREQVHALPAHQMGYIEMATLAIEAVDALEATVGFDVFDEEKPGRWANYVSTVHNIGATIMAFMMDTERRPTKADMKNIVKNSIDYF